MQIIDHTRDRTIEVESRTEGEDKLSEFPELELELVHNGNTLASNFEQTASDGGATRVVEESDESPVDEPKTTETGTDAVHELPDKPPVDEDPLVWMPEEFTDKIDGTVAINRKGFEVIAHHYGIETRSEIVSHDTETVVVKATAITDGGKQYESHGSASLERGDDGGLLIEMADTRARKRALSQASGVGMVAVSELKNEL